MLKTLTYAQVIEILESCSAIIVDSNYNNFVTFCYTNDDGLYSFAESEDGTVFQILEVESYNVTDGGYAFIVIDSNGDEMIITPVYTQKLELNLS